MAKVDSDTAVLSNMSLPNVEGDLLEILVTAIRRPLGRTRSNGRTNFASAYFVSLVCSQHTLKHLLRRSR